MSMRMPCWLSNIRVPGLTSLWLGRTVDRQRPDWRALNRKHWEERVPLHIDGSFYNVAGFKRHRDVLRPFEVAEVGEVSGKRLVHLQCHIGLDTLSWAARGATVVGLDFSTRAVDAARELAAELGTNARFVSADVYDAVEALDGATFDIVYTGIGSLQFLPDIERWARVVAALVSPGGFCYVTEPHPLLSFVGDDCRSYKGDYFSRDPIYLNEGTYADAGAALASPTSVEWVHHTAEVVSTLGAARLRVEFLHEHDWIWYPILPILTQ